MSDPKYPGAGAANGSGGGPSFLSKLLAMVEDPKYQHHIRWAPGGKSFIVFEPTPFAKEVLPRYFKHSNFTSFVRQLNMYDFHKVASVQNAGGPRYEWEFANDNFVRGRADLLDRIRRKAHSSADISPLSGKKADSVRRVLSQIEAIAERNQAIQQKMDTMESDNKIMWGEMSRLKNKHDMQQQTINRVLYFLTSVYAPDRIDKSLPLAESTKAINGPQVQAPSLILDGNAAPMTFNFGSTDSINNVGTPTGLGSPSTLSVHNPSGLRVGSVPGGDVNAGTFNRSPLLKPPGLTTMPQTAQVYF